MHTRLAVLRGVRAAAARRRLLRSAATLAARRAKGSASGYAWRPRLVMALQSHMAAASVGSLVQGSTQAQVRAVATSRSRLSHIRPVQHHQRHLSDIKLQASHFILIPLCNCSMQPPWRHVTTALINMAFCKSWTWAATTALTLMDKGSEMQVLTCLSR